MNNIKENWVQVDDDTNFNYWIKESDILKAIIKQDYETKLWTIHLTIKSLENISIETYECFENITEAEQYLKNNFKRKEETR